MNFYTKNIKLTHPISNNKFSYTQRRDKEIYIPRLTEGGLKDIRESSYASFIEISDDGKEEKCLGLETFIKIKDREIYVFDNHNHVFYFYYLKQLLNRTENDFIHIDQHKDLREPEIKFEDFKEMVNNQEYLKEILEKLSLKGKEIELTSKEDYEKFLAYAYTNVVLNVGNFIKPLMDQGLIANFYCIDSSYSMENLNYNSAETKYILDIDLDFFSKDMDYIDFDKKIKFIKNLIPRAEAVYFSTSPFFIDFNRCIRVLEILLEE